MRRAALVLPSVIGIFVGLARLIGNEDAEEQHDEGGEGDQRFRLGRASTPEGQLAAVVKGGLGWDFGFHGEVTMKERR